MKIKKIHMMTLSILTILMVYTSHLMAMKNMIDKTALAEREKIAADIAQTKTTIQTAQDAIHTIRKQELLGTIKRAQAARQLREQNTIIVNAERALGRMLKASVAAVRSAEQEYSLIAQAKEIGTQAVSLAKSGKIFSEKKKRLARREIKRLQEQQELLLKEYEDAMDVAQSAKEREKLKDRYEKIETEINEKIYKQQIIAGQEMSFAMKSFWSVIGAGALIATGRYFLGETIQVGATPPVPTLPASPTTQSTQKLVPTPPSVSLVNLPQTSETTQAPIPSTPLQVPIPTSPATIQPQVNADSTPVVMPEKKDLTPEERNLMMRKAIANFGWAALAGAHAIFFAADFAASSVLLSILNPSVGFAGIAAASGAAGLSKVIQLMSEKQKTDYLDRPNPSFVR